MIPAAAIAPGVMPINSSREARGRGPVRRERPVFPTEVGPRRMARRICHGVAKNMRRDHWEYLRS